MGDFSIDALVGSGLYDPLLGPGQQSEEGSQALQAIKAGSDLAEARIWVCPVCGDTFVGSPPDKCPVCGASLNDADPDEHRHEAEADPGPMAKLREIKFE